MLEGSTLFVYIADVYCPWCHAFAPIMKRIVAENPEIPVLVLGGNLISQPTTLADDVAASNDLVGFWEDVKSHVNIFTRRFMPSARTYHQQHQHPPSVSSKKSCLLGFLTEK